MFLRVVKIILFGIIIFLNTSIGKSPDQQAGSEHTLNCVGPAGDANGSGTHTLADIIAMVNYVFGKPGWPDCTYNSNECWLTDSLCRGDWNGSGSCTLTDIIQGVNFLFVKRCLGVGHTSPCCWKPLPYGACCLGAAGCPY